MKQPSEAQQMEWKIFRGMPGNCALLLPDAPAYTIVAATDGYFRTSGKTPERLIGAGLFDTFPEDPGGESREGAERIRTSLREVTASRATQQLPVYRYDTLNADGSFEPRYWKVTNQPILDDAGEVQYLLHIAEDVTGRVRAAHEEARLLDIEKSYSLFMQAPVIIGIVHGDSYVIKLANHDLLEVWGRTADVIGKSLFEAIPELEAQGFRALLDSVRHTGQSFYAYEHPIELVRNGKLETLYFDFVYKAYYEDGEAVAAGVFSVGHDVTQQVLGRKKLEESERNYRQLAENLEQRVEDRTAALQRTNANLEDFAFAASHDLKEPIRKIHFFSDRLKRQLEASLTEEQKNLFSRMELASQRMGALIDDLLTYSHTGKEVHYDPEPVHLASKVQEVLVDLELELEEKGATVQVDPLPQLQGDGRQFQQLFQNLIGNALKYGRPGVPPRIHIRATGVRGADAATVVRPEDAQAPFHLIAIQDNGIGFGQEHAERIFNVFTRLHSHAEYQGTGLGLAIVRRVVDNHRGYIWAEGKPEEGATFFILLPAS